MPYINIENTKTIELLALYLLPLNRFEKILSMVKQENDKFFHLSKKHEHLYKMLSSSEGMLSHYPTFKNMPQKEKQEWLTIKDVKMGDRSYASRYLIAGLNHLCPQICSELILPKFSEKSKGHYLEPLELSNDIDTLILARSIPAYFEYIDKLSTYKKGVFGPMRRAYINFIQVKSIYLISQFLKFIETDIEIIEQTLLQEEHLKSWPQIYEIVETICDQADPNHHDPLNLFTINCLRSIYISVFNIAMFVLMKKNEVPLELKQFLPVIPDRLGFTKNQLEIDNAWNRYQDHHFLFMKMSKEHKASLGECLSKLTPSQRVVWIGCLGREEILALLLPMVSQQSRFMNLIEACQEISPSDSQNYPFVYRVWEALNDIYKKYLQNKETTSEEIHQLFRQVFKEDTEILPHEKPAPSGSSPVPTGSSPAITTDVANLSDIKHLSFLVVDDSERIRQMTIKVLKEAGINTISEATDGVEAWSFLQKQAVDVILCDWIMPNMTGMELVQKMMQVDSIASKTSFLMLTTVNNKAAIVEALSVGVRGYLIKPFTRKQLLEKVFFATEWLRKEQMVD